MEIPKIKKEIYAHLPEVLRLVKAGALEREMGVRNPYISSRLNRNQNGPYSKRSFKPADVELLNRGMWSLGHKLLQMELTYIGDYPQCIKHLKDTLKDLFLQQLIQDACGLTKTDVHMRMLTGAASKGRRRLTADDYERITLAARQVGITLLSTEFYVEV